VQSLNWSVVFRPSALWETIATIHVPSGETGLTPLTDDELWSNNNDQQLDGKRKKILQDFAQFRNRDQPDRPTQC